MKSITLEQSITLKVLNGEGGVLALDKGYEILAYYETLAYYKKQFDIEDEKSSLLHSTVKLGNYETLDKLKGITLDILRENNLLSEIITANTIFFDIVPYAMVGDELEVHSANYHITLLGYPYRKTQDDKNNHVEFMVKCFECIKENKDKYLSLFKGSN